MKPYNSGHLQAPPVVAPDNVVEPKDVGSGDLWRYGNFLCQRKILENQLVSCIGRFLIFGL